MNISAAAEIAKGRFPVVVDGTFAGPLAQNPFGVGADIIVDSLTKVACGHGNAMGGIIAGAGPLIDHLFLFRKDDGASISPEAASTILTGLRTLAVRYERMEKNTIALVEMLQARDDVISKLHYPLLDPLYPELVRKGQMSGPGYMVTIELIGGLEAGITFINNLKLVEHAVSLGDFASRISHPASTTQALVPENEQRIMGITPGMVRLSIGGEAIGDIMQDIEQALEKVKNGQVNQAR